MLSKYRQLYSKDQKERQMKEGLGRQKKVGQTKSQIQDKAGLCTWIISGLIRFGLIHGSHQLPQSYPQLKSILSFCLDSSHVTSPRSY